MFTRQIVRNGRFPKIYKAVQRNFANRRNDPKQETNLSSNNKEHISPIDMFETLKTDMQNIFHDHISKFDSQRHKLSDKVSRVAKSMKSDKDKSSSQHAWSHSYSSNYIVDGNGNGQFNIVTGSGANDQPISYVLKRGLIREGQTQDVQEMKATSLDQVNWKDFYRLDNKSMNDGNMASNKLLDKTNMKKKDH